MILVWFWFRSSHDGNSPVDDENFWTTTLEAFRTKWSPDGTASPRQSISLRVANSVRREAQAVIAAISTAWAASARYPEGRSANVPNSATNWSPTGVPVNQPAIDSENP